MANKLPHWPFLNLERGRRIVHFTSQQVYDALANTNRSYMGSRAIGTPVGSAFIAAHVRSIAPEKLANLAGNLDGANPRKHVTDDTQARWQQRSLQVLQAGAAAQWAHLGHDAPAHPLYYQIGPWILRQGGTSEDHYFNIVGSAGQQREVGGGWFDTNHGHEVLTPDYAALLDHIANNKDVKGHNLNALVRGILRGEADPAVPASLATMVGALVVAEVQRRHPTQLVNNMWLDLVDQHVVQWGDLTENHSMARGGGKEIGPETRQREATLGIHWLGGQSLPGTRFEPSDTPVGDPAGQSEILLVKQLFHIRSDSLGGPAEMQIAADKFGET